MHRNNSYTRFYSAWASRLLREFNGYDVPSRSSPASIIPLHCVLLTYNEAHAFWRWGDSKGLHAMPSPRRCIGDMHSIQCMRSIELALIPAEQGHGFQFTAGRRWRSSTALLLWRFWIYRGNACGCDWKPEDASYICMRPYAPYRIQHRLLGSGHRAPRWHAGLLGQWTSFFILCSRSFGVQALLLQIFARSVGVHRDQRRERHPHAVNITAGTARSIDQTFNTDRYGQQYFVCWALLCSSSCGRSYRKFKYCGPLRDICPCLGQRICTLQWQCSVPMVSRAACLRRGKQPPHILWRCSNR